MAKRVFWLEWVIAAAAAAALSWLFEWFSLPPGQNSWSWALHTSPDTLLFGSYPSIDPNFETQEPFNVFIFLIQQAFFWLQTPISSSLDVFLFVLLPRKEFR